jgi:hypothetical protein
LAWVSINSMLRDVVGSSSTRRMRIRGNLHFGCRG